MNMGMYDDIDNVMVNCPRCGNIDPKSVQIKCGPQILKTYIFGKDEIDINWNYSYYGSIIDKDKCVILGIATCDNCKEESNKKMNCLIAEANRKEEIKCPNDAKYLFECEICGKNALSVILNRLNEEYGRNRNIDSFDVAIQLKDNVAISAEVFTFV
jgi:uncharacterized Zn finger protein